MGGNGRNVVLVTVDSLRADHCGFVDAPADTTPFLDALSENSVTFDTAIAPGPRTPSSVPELMTGNPLPIADVEDDLPVQLSHIRDHVTDSTLVSETLQQRGYETIAFTTNPWTTTETRFDSGFDSFTEIGESETTLTMGLLEGTPLARVADLLDQWYHGKSWFSQWPNFYDRILDAVDDAPEPFFLWVFLLDTHNPYIVPRRDRQETNAAKMYYGLLRGNSVFGDRVVTSYKDDIKPHVTRILQEMYRDATRSVDRFVETLLEDLNPHDPALVFHSDHGEAFGEHGTYGHQRVLYEENVHVPLLVHDGRRVEHVVDPISLRRIPDLVWDLTDGGIVDPHEWTSDAVVTRTESSEASAIRTAEWKYIVHEDGDALYHLARDPDESTDTSATEADKRAELRERLQAALEDVPVDDDYEAQPVDSDISNRLASLGYLE